MRKLLIYVLLIPLVLCLPVNADDLVIFKTPKKGVVNAAGVNLRSRPGLDEQIVGIIHKKDTLVDILGQQGDWFKVKAEEGEAWIYEDYVALKPADPISASEQTTDKTAATGEEADSFTGPSDITTKPEEAAAPAEDADVYPLPEEAAVLAENTDMPASTDEQKHIDTSQDKEKDHEEAFKVNDKTEAEEGDSFNVLIKDILFSGNTVITTEKLQKLSEQYKNKDLTMEEMSELADLVTMTYQEKGYILARAYLPEQEIKDGVLKISIAEGRIGKIKVIGKTHYKPEVIKRYFKQQQKLGVINESLLEKGILLANEIPKTKTGIILKEGEKPGEVDVVLDVKDSSVMTFTVDVGFDYNNFGSEFISKDRYGATVNITDHNWGTTFKLRGIIGNTYDDSALGNIDFTVPINSYGTKVSLNYLKGNYVVGRELVDLSLEGRTRNYGARILHPIIKKKNKNLNLTFGYAHKYSESGLFQEITNIDVMDVYNINLDFDNLDRFLGKNIVSLGYYWGNVDPDTEIEPSRLKFRKRFQKILLSTARIQKIYGYTNFMLRASGQLSGDRLLPIEQSIIGGYYTVRGHDPSIYLGDSGYNISGELMFAPPLIADKTVFGQRVAQMVQLALFYDHAGVFNNDLVSSADEYKSEYLSGYGGGIRFYYKDVFSLKYDVGFPRKRTTEESELYNYIQMSFNFF